MDVVFCFAVVPGTDSKLFQKGTAEKFKRKDSGGVYHASQQRRQPPDQMIERSDQGGHTVDGEHPERGVPH